MLLPGIFIRAGTRKSQTRGGGYVQISSLGSHAAHDPGDVRLFALGANGIANRSGPHDRHGPNDGNALSSHPDRGYSHRHRDAYPHNCAGANTDSDCGADRHQNADASPYRRAHGGA
jgi:hypothetical protein